VFSVGDDTITVTVLGISEGSLHLSWRSDALVKCISLGDSAYWTQTFFISNVTKYHIDLNRIKPYQ